MRVTGYAYAWDVLGDNGSDGFLARAAEVGVDEVAVAACYHAARAATPYSSARSAVVAEYAALYRPVLEAAWAGRPLRPRYADWVDVADAAGDAVRALNRAGMPAALWLVLTHNSRLGAAAPEFTVRNCFGEHYAWALCPAQPAVREYAATLAAESVRDLDLSSIILESCGQMGVTHQHLHEKTDGVWAPATARLLSVCCCPACAAGWSAEGLDPGQVVDGLRAEVRRLLDTGDLAVTDDALPDELRATLLSTRQRNTDALRAEVLAAIGATDARIVLHGSADPWVTGALPGLTPSAAADAAAVVVPCWQPGQASLDAVRAAVTANGPAVGAYVTGVAAAPVPDFAGYIHDLANAGATETHLYHLGLAGPARRPHLREAVTAAHAS